MRATGSVGHLALAQQPKAGVVTTLQGRAMVARPVLPQPGPLKFKDDVFLQDRIATRENSVARLLLGADYLGKPVNFAYLDTALGSCGDGPSWVFSAGSWGATAGSTLRGLHAGRV